MAYGDGSFNKTKRGYRLRFSYVSDTDGKRYPFSVNAATKEECKRLRN